MAKKPKKYLPLYYRDAQEYKTLPVSLVSPLAARSMVDPWMWNAWYPDVYETVAPQAAVFCDWGRKWAPEAPPGALALFGQMAARTGSDDYPIKLPCESLADKLTKEQLLALVTLTHGRYDNAAEAPFRACLPGLDEAPDHLWAAHRRARKAGDWKILLREILDWWELAGMISKFERPPEIEDEDKSDGEECDTVWGVCQWLPFRVIRPPLPKQRVKRPTGEAYAGLCPKPARAALARLGYKCFKKEQKSRGRRIAVLLDISGSMQLAVPHVLEALAEATSLSNLVIYGSTDEEGLAWVVIKEGVGLDRYNIMSYFGKADQNWADYPILKWFRDEYHSHRKIWVSDTLCAPIGAPDFMYGSRITRQYCKQNGIEIALDGLSTRRLLT